MPSKGKGRSVRKRPAVSDDGAKSEKTHGDCASSAKRRNTSPSRKSDAPHSSATRTTRSHATVSAEASLKSCVEVECDTKMKQAAPRTPRTTIKTLPTTNQIALPSNTSVRTKKAAGKSVTNDIKSPKPEEKRKTTPNTNQVKKTAVKKKATPKKTAGKKTTPSSILKQKTASKTGKAVAAKKAVTTKKQNDQSAASNKSAVSPQPKADDASAIGCDSQPDHNPDIATEPQKPTPTTSRQRLTAQPEVDLDRVIREHDNFDDDLSSSAEPIINQELIFTTDEDVKKLFTHPNVYEMSAGCRGRALILNNERFEQKVNPDQDELDYREGSDVDCTNIEIVLEKLGFIVTVKTNQDTEKMRNEIQKETEREDQANYGMFILVVLSHGDRDVVYGSDGRKISSDDIVDLLNPQKFVGMKGKPKWIIQQTCSGAKTDTVQPDTNQARFLPPRTNKTYTSVSDLYILKSSFPGYMSLRNTTYGSYMIRSLVEVLYRYAAHKDLYSLTIEVRNRVMERSGTGDHKFGVQTVYDSGTLRKRIYLFPGYKSQLPILDKPMNIPIRLSETPSNTNTPTTLSNPAIPVLPIPTRLQYRDSQTAPNQTFCVHFTREGKLLNSGMIYGISGLSFTFKIPTDNKRINLSICEHNQYLYLLQYHTEHDQYYVHKINLSSQTVSENIIKFQGCGWAQQLVVNDEFIIISGRTAKCVRVYSTKNSAHLFNIKHECISKWPWVVGLLGDSLVVGDYMKNQVSNMTINERPEVRWTCTGITDPTGLRVVENPQMILVASHRTKQIYILSYQGQKLSTLDVPECSTRIFDIAVYDQKLSTLAVSDSSTNVIDITVSGKQITVADTTSDTKE